MKPKHTPGPWLYDPSTGEIALPPGSSRNFVGRFHCGRDDHGTDARPTRADAALIIAAPRLLWALENLVENAEDHGKRQFAVEHAREIIETAKGR